MSLSTFLNGRAPSTLRGLAMLALSDTGNVLAGSATSDSGGGGTVTWTAGGTINCRLDPLTTANARTTGGAIDERSTHIVTAPSDLAVTTANRFAVTGRGTFEVTAVRQRTDQATQIFEVIPTS